MRINMIHGALLLAPLAAVPLANAALQIHLPFDENVGATAFNDGLTGATNDVPFSANNGRVAGAIGGGISFDNSANSSIVAGSNPLPEDTLRTISFWFNTTATSTGLDTYLSFGTNNNPPGGTDPGTKFDVSVDTGTGHLEVGVGGGRTDSAAVSISTPVVNDGVWRLATVSIPDLLDDDPSFADISDIDIYVDGVFSYNGSANNSPDRTISTDPNGQFFLGRRANDGGGEFVDGLMDDVGVWDSALTPDEIKGLYDVGSQLSVNAGVYDQVLALHGAGAGTIFAGDYEWTFASGLVSAAGITGSDLVLDDAANTGVTFAALVPGDVNRDTVVDLTDFGIIQANFLDSVVSRDDGDLNGDGLVDFGDFRIWKDASGASVSTTIPEPTGLVLTVVAAGAFVLRRRGVVLGALAMTLTFGVAHDGFAQATNVYFTTANGDYNTNGNWDVGFVPEAFLDEIAVIGSNSADGMLVGAVDDATATLSNTPFEPAGVELGDGFGSVGRLTIQTGGSLAIPGTTTVTSGIRVGQGENGRGFLTIGPGGSLSAYSLNLNGQTDGLDEADWSTVTLSGDASLTATTANIAFNRVIEVTGPDVTIEAVGDVSIGNRGRYIANITGPTHSVMRSDANVQIDGVLIPNFSGSATPTEGSSWDLFDSATVAGQFDEVRVPGRVPGQGFVLEQRAGGNGVITSLAIRSVLVLEVDRDSGQIDITQPFGSPVSIDGYSIESASGNLGSGTWTSLDSQNVDDWTEANASSTALNELKPTTSTAFSGSGFSLGEAYTPDFSTFGQTVEEDLVFEYFDTTTGQIVQGEVVYSGVKVNNLVLVVDPDTGEAQLRNTSDASVGIDGYQITSPSGALTPGGWDSLQDQASADWFEAEQTSLALAELLPAGVETLAGDTGYNLGSIFSTLGDQDLVLEYFASDANVLQTGQVLYAELPPIDAGLLGDANGDGKVDLLDLDILGANFGIMGGATIAQGDFNDDGNVDLLDLDILGANFGAMSATAVPEGSSALLGLIATSLGMASRRGRRDSTVDKARSTPEASATTSYSKTRYFAIAVVVSLSMAGSALAQVTLFDHNFENAPNPGTAVTAVGDLGAPATGSFSFSGSPIGGIGGTLPALAVGHNSNGIANMTQPTENSVAFDAIVDPDNNSFPETQVVDAGSGDLVFADFASAGPVTSSATSTDISFAFGIFGTNNTGQFKHQYIRGLDGSGNEVFELLFVAGSNNASRQWYARGPSDDSIELTASNSGTPDGSLLGDDYDAFNSTSVANGRPAGAYLIDISLSDGNVTYDITTTNGSGTPTSLMGMGLPINSAATSISQLEFSSVWNASVNGQNKGYWVDDLFAITSPLGSFPEGDVNLDGFVTIDDFNIIASNFKESASSRSQGDLNDDGFVDFTDFRIWKDASQSSTSSAIPEPSAATLVLLSALAGVCLRGRAAS